MGKKVRKLDRGDGKRKCKRKVKIVKKMRDDTRSSVEEHFRSRTFKKGVNPSSHLNHLSSYFNN